MYIDYDLMLNTGSPFEEYAESCPETDKFFLARSVILKELYRSKQDAMFDCGSFWVSKEIDCYYDPDSGNFLDIKTDEHVTNSAALAGPSLPMFDKLSQLKQYIAASGTLGTRKDVPTP